MTVPRIILALDLATLCGVAEVDPGSPPRFYSVRFASPGDEHASSFARVRRWIDERLSVGDIAAVYVEAPVSPGALQGQTNAATVARLVGLWAVVAASAGVWRVKYRDVEVQAARRAFLGDGRLRRDEAKARAMQMAKSIGWSPNTLDEADAAAVLYFALTREAPNLAPLISPMLQHQVATSVENERILRDQEKRAKGLKKSGKVDEEIPW